MPLSALIISDQERKSLGYIGDLTEEEIEWLVMETRKPPEDIEVARARWKKLQEKEWVPFYESPWEDDLED